MGKEENLLKDVKFAVESMLRKKRIGELVEKKGKKHKERNIKSTSFPVGRPHPFRVILQPGTNWSFFCPLPLWGRVREGVAGTRENANSPHPNPLPRGEGTKVWTLLKKGQFHPVHGIESRLDRLVEERKRKQKQERRFSAPFGNIRLSIPSSWQQGQWDEEQNRERC